MDVREKFEILADHKEVDELLVNDVEMAGCGVRCGIHDTQGESDGIAWV